MILILGEAQLTCASFEMSPVSPEKIGHPSEKIGHPNVGVSQCLSTTVTASQQVILILGAAQHTSMSYIA